MTASSSPALAASTQRRRVTHADMAVLCENDTASPCRLPGQWLVRLAVALLVVLLAPSALAQVQVNTVVSPTIVEVGQPAAVTASVTTEGESPSSPRLSVPKGFSVRGPNVSTSHQISITGAGMKRLQGLNATWQIIPSKAGTFQIGPASLATSNGRIQGPRVTLKVVPQGSLPKTKQRPRRRRSPFGTFDPFDDDLFNGPGGSIFDDLFGNRGLARRHEAPEEYRLNKARDPLAFLNAKVSKRQVVLGEQVSLEIFAYGSRGRFGELNSREPRHPDFFAHNLQERTRNPESYIVDIGGRQFRSMRLRYLALFPLKAGELKIGPMKTNFYGSRYITSRYPEGLERQSQPLMVRVVEPPVQGRPPGYQLGDVGDYTLTAQVSPRQVEAGGAISVVATLRGTGLVPSRLLTPDQSGVQWLDPTIKSNLSPNPEGLLGGERTFTYVVSLDKPGVVDLGELQLPFYSTSKRRYGTARVKLGKVTVKPAKPGAQGPKAPQPAQRLKLSELLQVRHYVPEAPRSQSMWVDQAWFWPSLLVGPFGVLVFQTTRGASSNFLRRRRSKLDSPEHHAQKALKEAKQALAHENRDAALSATEKALFLSIEAATGLKARALLMSELQAKLKAELSPELGERVCQLLKDCDSARFAGEAIALDTLVKDAESAVKALNKSASHKTRGSR